MRVGYCSASVRPSSHLPNLLSAEYESSLEKTSVFMLFIRYTVTCKYITFNARDLEENRSQSTKQKNHSDSVLLKNLKCTRNLALISLI